MLSLQGCVYFNNIPKYIKKLIIDFDDYDNINIDNLHNGLEELYILEESGGNFNKPINNLPNTLKKLCIISCEFNQSLDYLPKGLKELVILNGEFNQSLDNLPNTLEYLVIHKYVKVEDIYINESYLMNLPPSLKTLHLYNQFIDEIQKRIYKTIILEKIIN